MWYKVSWLSFWVTMILWLGNFWGCAKPGQEQNYRMLEDEQPSPVQHEGETAAPGEDGARFVSYQPNDAPPTEPDDAPPTDSVSPDRVADDAAPILLRGLDRSHYPTIVTGPEVGVTWHYPIYYKDWRPQSPSERHRVNFAEPIEEQWADALHNPYANNWDLHNAGQLAIQPLKAAFDTGAAPVQMILGAPPWLKVPSYPDSTQRFAYPID